MQTLFDKTYAGEELGDVSNDVFYALEELEEDLIQKDEHGFCTGTFRVTITWESGNA